MKSIYRSIRYSIFVFIFLILQSHAGMVFNVGDQSSNGFSGTFEIDGLDNLGRETFEVASSTGQSSAKKLLFFSFTFPDGTKVDSSSHNFVGTPFVHFNSDNVLGFDIFLYLDKYNNYYIGRSYYIQISDNIAVAGSFHVEKE